MNIFIAFTSIYLSESPVHSPSTNSDMTKMNAAHTVSSQIRLVAKVPGRKESKRTRSESGISITRGRQHNISLCTTMVCREELEVGGCEG